MSMITLGGFNFQNWEVPEIVKSGGPEQHAIHMQPGGARTIDILGRNETTFFWSGRLISNDSSASALQIEGIKVSGGVYALVYGPYNQDVVITKLDFMYHRQNWVDYTIECTPIFNADAGAQAGVQGLQGGVAAAGGLT